MGAYDNDGDEKGLAGVKRMTRGSKEYTDTMAQLLRETGKPGAHPDDESAETAPDDEGAESSTDIYGLKGRRR